MSEMHIESYPSPFN